MQRWCRELSRHNEGDELLYLPLSSDLLFAGRREERGNAELGVEGQLHHADIQVTVFKGNQSHIQVVQPPKSRRPLKAEDQYDTTILTSHPQVKKVFQTIK